MILLEFLRGTKEEMQTGSEFLLSPALAKRHVTLVPRENGTPRAGSVTGG